MPDALPQAWLEFADGRVHWLDQNACTIGRILSNTLALDQPGLSRSHAMIQPTPGGGWFLTDLRSTNGTYHNGLRLEQGVTLRDGDKLELGDTTLTFRCQQSAETAPEAGATSVQIHSGDCWLLMLDLIGHTAHTHAVGAEAASADFKRWLELVRPGLIRSGGTINAYLGDALFAYWRQDRHPLTRSPAPCRNSSRSKSPHPGLSGSSCTTAASGSAAVCKASPWSAPMSFSCFGWRNPPSRSAPPAC
jgi:pSer/pThr/pTyr-binding forkhead associated (FHA) protein